MVASEEKGSSNLNIERQYDVFPQVSVGFNNSGAGNNANGRNQATLNIAWSDLLGTNDRWSFSVVTVYIKIIMLTSNAIILCLTVSL